MANAVSTTGTGADDFVPAPEGQAPVANDLSTATEVAPAPPAGIEAPSLGQTEIILSSAAIIVAAGLLLFLKGAIRRSLIASRASIDRANAAAWAWYVVILLLVILVIAGVVGDLFDSLYYIILTAVVLVLGIVMAAKMTSSARRSV